MGGRRKSRELALQILYQIDVNHESPRSALDLFWWNFKSWEDHREFTERLVEGVCEYRKEIDTIIKKHSENWKLERMPRVDRNVLRLAVYEIFYCHDIPFKVTINEAVDLGKKYGTEKSGSFINGILDSVSISIHGDGTQSIDQG